jgi:hypothetical protein
LQNRNPVEEMVMELHRAEPPHCPWLVGEPMLLELLQDPVAVSLMERDGVDADALIEFLTNMQKVLSHARPQ